MFEMKPLMSTPLILIHSSNFANGTKMPIAQRFLQPEAMHLATKGQDGAPTRRYVLYKDPEKYGLDIDGIIFTSLNSLKAVDIQKFSQIALMCLPKTRSH